MGGGMNDSAQRPMSGKSGMTAITGNMTMLTAG